MKNFSIITYIDRVKKDSKNCAPIYCRIDCPNSTKKFSFGIKVEIGRWESTDELTKAKAKLTEKEKKHRQTIDDKVSKMKKYAERMDEDEMTYTAEMVYNQLENPNPHKNKTLLQAFDAHKIEFDRLVHVGDRKASGYKKYHTVRGHIEKYIPNEYKTKDILLSLLDDDFQKGFQSYLVGKVGKNAISKYIQHLRSVVVYVKECRWIKETPFDHYKLTIKKPKKVYLTIQEVLSISHTDMPLPYLDVTKDIFLFNILTGYAWTDVSKLTYKDVCQVGEATQILAEREKTYVEANVVLTKEAMSLIDKYRDNEICQATGKLFPFKSNQKMNAALKVIQDLAGIEKNLTTKIARNTYATLCLNKGMMMKALSVSMGHTNQRQTEEYATLLNGTLVEEMKKMEGVLQLKVA